LRGGYLYVLPWRSAGQGSYHLVFESSQAGTYARV
jgi:hypothetical protein